jgi:hypothetical protein
MVLLPPFWSAVLKKILTSDNQGDPLRPYAQYEILPLYDYRYASFSFAHAIHLHEKRTQPKQEQGSSRDISMT